MNSEIIRQQCEVFRLSPDVQRLLLPLFASRVSAGFPSPAEDFVEKELDPLDILVKHPAATYFVRVSGQSMRGCWIRDGDIAVVDASVTPAPGHIVVAVLDSEMLVKQLGVDEEGRVVLKAANPKYPDIVVNPEQNFQVWGVVTWTLHQQLLT